MSDPLTIAIIAGGALASLVILAAAALKGWQGWLDLQRLAIAGSAAGTPATTPGARIELADLRERVRKLEAIAAGVDL